MDPPLVERKSIGMSAATPATRPDTSRCKPLAFRAWPVSRLVIRLTRNFRNAHHPGTTATRSARYESIVNLYKDWLATAIVVAESVLGHSRTRKWSACW